MQISKYSSLNARFLSALALVCAVFSIPAEPARAEFLSVQAKVVVLEATYMPRRVRFSIDQALGRCAAQTWLDYDAPDADPDNANAVYGMLMVALTGQLSVRVFDRTENNEPGRPCSIDFIHLDPR